MIDRRRRTRDAAERARELASRASANRAGPGDASGTGAPARPRPPRAKTEPASETITLTIDAVAAGGEGVGRADGMAVFIPRSAPGDVIEATVVKHRRFARGRIARVLTPSPLRVEPLCRHYDKDDCGGCQMQHLTAAAQLAAKAQIVCDTIARIGRRQIETPAIEASPRVWEYRQKLTLTLRRDSEAANWIGGLHRLGEPNEIFALEECRITLPSLVATWHEVRDAAALLPNGTALRVTFRQAEGSARVAITVSGGTEWKHAAEFAARVGSLAALWWIADSGERTEVVAPDDSAEETAANFVQANVTLAPALHAYVREEVLRFNPKRVIDAYAGSGALSVELANQGIAVTAIEWDASAVALLHSRLPDNSVVLAASVEGVIDRALYQPAVPDVVVLNPPRVGLHQDVTSALDAQGTSGVRAIVYVSCDPATLARDLARLPAWRIHSVRCFDMFPQTAHVEAVCVLIPESS